MTMVELASPMITFPAVGSFRGGTAEDCAGQDGIGASAERAAAKNAASLAARRVHQELAQNYATLAKRSQQREAA